MNEIKPKPGNIINYLTAFGQFVIFGLLFTIASPFIILIFFWDILQDIVKSSKECNNEWDQNQSNDNS